MVDLDNHSYNLIKALSKKAQAVFRYDQYLKDAEACEECKKLWEKLKNEDSTHVEEIKKILAKHIKEGKI